MNKSVQRKQDILQCILSFFTKLDANSGLWQVKLLHNSSLLTTFITLCSADFVLNVDREMSFKPSKDVWAYGWHFWD